MVVVLLAKKNQDMVDVLLKHKKSSYGCCPTGKKVQIWLLSCWHIQQSRYGCCPASIFNSLDMVDALLVHKESRHGY